MRVLIRLAVIATLLLAVWIGFSVWNYHRSPAYAVKQVLKAYEHRDQARAEPFLTARGTRLFIAATDDDAYSKLRAVTTEPGEIEAAKAVFHFHGVTRYGAVEADLRLVREDARWKLDEVLIVSAQGNPIGFTGSELMQGGMLGY